MKILSILLTTIALSVSAQEGTYHTVTCYSDSEGWIEALINKQQPNDQMLRVYSQGGLGPNSLEASYVSVGNTNRFALSNDAIQLEADYSASLNLTIEFSVATLRANLGGQPAIYSNCQLK